MEAQTYQVFLKRKDRLNGLGVLRRDSGLEIEKGWWEDRARLEVIQQIRHPAFVAC